MLCQGRNGRNGHHFSARVVIGDGGKAFGISAVKEWVIR